MKFCHVSESSNINQTSGVIVMFVSVPFSHSNPQPEKNDFCADVDYRLAFHRITRQSANIRKQQFLVSLTWGAVCSFEPESSYLLSDSYYFDAFGCFCSLFHPQALFISCFSVAPDRQRLSASRVLSPTGITAAVPSMVQPSFSGMGLF